MAKARGYFGAGGSKKKTGAHPNFMGPKVGTGKPKSAGIPNMSGDGDPGRGSISGGLSGNYGKNANVTQGKSKTFC